MTAVQLMRWCGLAVWFRVPCCGPVMPVVCVLTVPVCITHVAVLPCPAFVVWSSHVVCSGA